MEAKKCAEWSAKKNRIEEASRKKTELDKEFSNQTRETLIAKMDNYGGNREAIMADMKDKLKVRVDLTRRNAEKNALLLSHSVNCRRNSRRSKRLACHWNSRKISSV